MRAPAKAHTPGRRILRPKAGGVARFTPFKPTLARANSLPLDHPAIVEGRTLFPGKVEGPWTGRLLISGINNPKTGAKVLKGVWAGFPIYTLTLEERKTCPRSCTVYTQCYGNGMQWPKRNDVSDPDFMAALAMDVAAAARQHPDGFVVRLHILGDFYSVKYVLFWALLLEMFPNLRVYGYTARRIDADDLESRKIAQAIGILTKLWSRFAIRTSHPEFGPGRSVVVDEDPKLPDVIVCPAQTEKTAACATCAMCWNPALQRKTIAFLRHGPARGRRPKEPIA
jgi:hypothetical protein